MGSGTAGPMSTDRLRLTVAIHCTPGAEHRWRTVARGTAVIAGAVHTAAVYEENDTTITCRR